MHPPIKAANAFAFGPPERAIPPKTIAISIFIPTDEPVDVVTDSVGNVAQNAARPIPTPAIVKEINASLTEDIPESLAQTGFPPRNFCSLPILVK